MHPGTDGHRRPFSKGGEDTVQIQGRIDQGGDGLDLAEEGQLGLHLLEHPAMGNGDSRLLGQSHGKRDFPDEKLRVLRVKRRINPINSPWYRIGKVSTLLMPSRLAASRSGRKGSLSTWALYTGYPDRIMERVSSVSITSRERYSRDTVGGAEDKEHGSVEQSDGAGIDGQQLRQTADNGVHHLLMVKNHGGQPGNLLEYP